MFQLSELGARRILEGGIFFSLGMEPDIERDQLVDLSCLYSRATTPLAIGNNQLAELRAPVAEMVDADAVPACIVVKQLQRMTDNSRSEMTYMKRFCHIRRRIIENNGFAFTYI